jgi:hypothetical protein
MWENELFEMQRMSSYPASAGGMSPLPPAPLPKLLRGKHLDAVLLALVQQRKLEADVLPGIPFN